MQEVDIVGQEETEGKSQTKRMLGRRAKYESHEPDAEEAGCVQNEVTSCQSCGSK